ncbi:MAG: helicase-related protein [Myxococcota bacterium]
MTVRPSAATSRQASAPKSASPYPPGSRVRARGEEWAVETCLPVPTGGYAVHVHGLTELVRHHKAVFLTELDSIEALRPEDTALVADPSAEYRHTRLFLETLLRRTPPTEPLLHIGHRAAMEPMPYQLVPARMGLENLRPRILVADGVGLGKTIEVGILLSELIKRGRGRRILVVCIKSMLAQLQQELWTRFTIPLVRLDSEGIQRVQAKIPSNKNPFSYYDRAIVSVDTLKNNARYRAWLEQSRWDAIVVDECHNVANRGSQREVLARLLAATTDALLLTSATPHNGRPESFANLMRMLDPTAIADERDYGARDIDHLFVRRFKKDVEAEAGKSFSERQIHRHDATATDDEERALAALRSVRAHTLGRKRHREDRLFRWVLVKAFLSSPHACLESIDARLARIDQALAPDPGDGGAHPHDARLREDAEALRELRVLVETCTHRFSKLDRLVEQLRALGFDGGESSPRVIVFSERIETLHTLQSALAEAFRIRDPHRRIAVFDASLSDIEQKDFVDSFGKKESPLRLLLASDAASEGVNLHYYCHQLFHFDVPWSLIRLEQRMGRIDRFGQKHTPHLHYLLTRTEDQGADQQIVDRLIAKEDQVHKQLGEAGVVLGLYDAEAEEEHLTTQLAEGVAPEDAIPDVPVGRAASVPSSEADAGDTDDTDDAAAADTSDDPGLATGIDLLALFSQTEAPASEPLAQATAELPSLYSGDYAFARMALQALEDHPMTGEGRFPWEADDDRRVLRIHAPKSFTEWRQPFLPEEAVPASNEPYRLVADRDFVQAHIDDTREAEGQWPHWHLLWEQHPLVEWLLDSLGALYARNEAPLILAPRLGARRVLYLFQGVQYNQRSQPIQSKWFGVQGRVEPKPSWDAVLDLDQVLDLTGFSDGLTNTGDPVPAADAIRQAVPDAVARAHEHIADLRKEAVRTLRTQVRHAARRLKHWQDKRTALLDAQEARSRQRNRGRLPAIVEKRLADDRRDVERFARDHETWLQSLQSHGDPYIRLTAVFTGAER